MEYDLPIETPPPTQYWSDQSSVTTSVISDVGDISDMSDSASIAPSDSVSNHEGNARQQWFPENVERVPTKAGIPFMTDRLAQLQIKSNQLTTMFNDESTYRRVKDEQSSDISTDNWLEKCIEVINDTKKMQWDIIDYHLNKYKRKEVFPDGCAKLSEIEAWMEQIAAIWARTHHQLRLYSFLQNGSFEGQSLIMSEVRKFFSILVQESFHITQHPTPIIALRQPFTTKIDSLIPKFLANIRMVARVDIIDLNQFTKISQSNQLMPGSFYQSNIGVFEKGICNTYSLILGQSGNSVKFENLVLCAIKRKEANEVVFDSQYHLLYQIVIELPDFNMILTCRFTSRSFVVVEASQEGIAWPIHAWRFLFRHTVDAFRNQLVTAPWSQVFFFVIHPTFYGVTKAMLSRNDSFNLARKFYNNIYLNDLPDNPINWRMLVEERLPNRQFTFWQWFFSTICLIREVLKNYWRPGGGRKIIGYISRERAERLLYTQPPGTFLLRFSDSRLGAISIAYVTEVANMKKVYMIKPFDREDLIQRSLADRLSDFDELTHLYPNVRKEEAFGEFYTRRPGQPGQRLGSDGYAELIVKPKLP